MNFRGSKILRISLFCVYQRRIPFPHQSAKFFSLERFPLYCHLSVITVLLLLSSCLHLIAPPLNNNHYMSHDTSLHSLSLTGLCKYNGGLGCQRGHNTWFVSQFKSSSQSDLLRLSLGLLGVGLDNPRVKVRPFLWTGRQLWKKIVSDVEEHTSCKLQTAVDLFGLLQVDAAPGRRSNGYPTHE